MNDKYLISPSLSTSAMALALVILRSLVFVHKQKHTSDISSCYFLRDGLRLTMFSFIILCVVQIDRLGGGGSDFASFLQHAGVPSMDLYFREGQ